MKISFKPPSYFNSFDIELWNELGVKAAIVLPDSIYWDSHIAWEVSGQHIKVVNFSGWNGSFHNSVSVPSIERVVVIATRKRGGMLGKLRKVARRYCELHNWRKVEIYEVRKTVKFVRVRVALIRRGIWREEGD